MLPKRTGFPLYEIKGNIHTPGVRLNKYGVSTSTKSENKEEIKENQTTNRVLHISDYEVFEEILNENGVVSEICHFLIGDNGILILVVH